MRSFKKQIAYPEWFQKYAGALDKYPDMSRMENQYALYKRMSSLFTAIDVVAKIGAPVKHSVKRMEAEELVDIPNHDYEKLLMNPNPFMSGYAFAKTTIKWLMLGRAYWWLNATNDTMPPSEMWVIPANRIAPIPDGRMGVKGYAYDPGDGKIMILPPEQIIMLGEGDLLSPLEAFSPIETVALTAYSDLEMQKYNNKLYRGNGRLPGVMAFADSIGNDEWRKMRKEVEEAAENRNIMMLRGVGSGQVQWIQGQNAPRDLEFMAGRKENRNEIWNTFAQGLVSMLSENATEANARTGKATLIDLVVYPLLQYIDSEVTAKLLPRYGTDLVVEPDDIRITDRVLELQEIAEYSKTHTVDEVRKQFWNDDPITNEEIGVLLVAQAQSAPKPVQPAPQMPASAGNPTVDVQTQQQQVVTKADPRSAILELEKWERVAKKSKTKGTEFETYNIPRKIADSIKADLPNSGSAAAIKALFVTARQDVIAEMGHPVPQSEAAAVLEGLRLAIEYAKQS